MLKKLLRKPVNPPAQRRLLRVLLVAAAWPAVMSAATTPVSSPENQSPEVSLPGVDEKLPTMIVTAATRTARTLAEVPVRTEVVSLAEIELRSPTNFSQAIELVNGVRVESNCQNCNTSEVQMLGLGGAYNQILFDGVPLLSSLGKVYGLEQIPASFVDRIEVVKGGGASLYGAGAVAGVINLVSAQPVENGGTVHGGVEYMKGEPLWLTDARLDRVFGDGLGGVSVYGQFSDNDAIDYNGDGYSEITRKREYVGGVQLWLAPVESTRLRINYQYLDESRRGGNRLDQPEYLANIAEALDTAYHRGGVVWEQEISDNVDFHVGYAFAYIARDSFYGGLGNVVTDPAAPGYDATQLDPTVPGSAASVSYNQYGYTENPLHYVDTQLNWRVADHTVSVGVQYKYESILDENRNYLGQTLGIIAAEHYDNVGVFVQDEWKVSSPLTLLFGGRLDKSSALDNPVFSPRIAATYEITDTVKVLGNISTGFRAPEIFSEDLHVDTLGATPVRTRNAPGLHEEKSVTYALGIAWKNDPVRPTWGADLMVSLTDIDDTFAVGPILTDPLDGSLYQERTNASGSLVAGVEANLVWQPMSSWKLSVGGAYYDSRYDDPQVVYDDGTTVLSTRDYLKTPHWSAVAQATWLPSEHWETFVGLKYTGPMQVLNNNTATINRTQNFFVVDIGLVYHLDLGDTHLDISVGIKNLLDQRQRDLESGPDRDSDYVYGPRFARSYYASVRWMF